METNTTAVIDPPAMEVSLPESVAYQAGIMAACTVLAAAGNSTNQALAELIYASAFNAVKDSLGEKVVYDMTRRFAELVNGAENTLQALIDAAQLSATADIEMPAGATVH
jgi:hypothetical protein